MAEIAVIRTHITNYFKTKDVYAQYKKVSFSHRFFETHRKEITIHKTAKNTFEKMDKIPNMKELNAEYGELLSLKKRLYSEYR